MHRVMWCGNRSAASSPLEPLSLRRLPSSGACTKDAAAAAASRLTDRAALSFSARVCVCASAVHFHSSSNERENAVCSTGFTDSFKRESEDSGTASEREREGRRREAKLYNSLSHSHPRSDGLPRLPLFCHLSSLPSLSRSFAAAPLPFIRCVRLHVRATQEEEALIPLPVLVSLSPSFMNASGGRGARA